MRPTALPADAVATSPSRCPACEAESCVLVDKVSYGPARLWRCPVCRSEFLHPQPTDARLAEIYSDDYYQPWGYETPDRLRAMKELTFSPLIERVRQRQPSAVLDLGCATGELLSMLHADGVKLFGIDLNERAITVARDRLDRASFHAGTLRDHPFPGLSFDVVTMVDFLEHVRDPEGELRLVADRLSPGGVVIISTPRAGSVVHRLTRRAWPQYREEHLTYLSRSGGERLVSAAGFRVTEVATTRKAITPAYFYGQALAYPVPVVTPLVKALRRLPFPDIGPRRLWFGEMTIVAERLAPRATSAA